MRAAIRGSILETGSTRGQAKLVVDVTPRRLGQNKKNNVKNHKSIRRFLTLPHTVEAKWSMECSSVLGHVMAGTIGEVDAWEVIDRQSRVYAEEQSADFSDSSHPRGDRLFHNTTKCLQKPHQKSVHEVEQAHVFEVKRDLMWYQAFSPLWV